MAFCSPYVHLQSAIDYEFQASLKMQIFLLFT